MTWAPAPVRGSLSERLLCRIGLHLFMPDRAAPGGASCCLCRVPYLKDSATPADKKGGPVPPAPARHTPHSPRRET